MLNTILFDLDGTLLPMDMDSFMKLYFKHLVAKFAEYGYPAGKVTDAVWLGTGHMVKNNGERMNHEVFWEAFTQQLGGDTKRLKPALERFYENEFHAAKAATGPNPKAPSTIATLVKKGYTVVLATNPLFPEVAVRTRLSWVGIDAGLFTHITTYDNSRFCKPNPAYYSDVLDTVGRKPENCFMIGNDATEDMAAAKIGVPVYLVTNELINKHNIDISPLPNGTFNDCAEWLDTLPPVG